jgi:hypothetical protein
MQRDDNGPAIMVEEPTDYHIKAIEETHAKIKTWSTMTKEEKLDSSRVELVDRMNEYNERKVAGEEKYKSMIAKVEEWEPPTSDHEGLKSFMLSQLRESIRFDCSPFDVPTEADVAKHANSKMGKLKDSIAYHEKEHAKEVERCNNRNEWKSALVESIGAPK